MILILKKHYDYGGDFWDVEQNEIETGEKTERKGNNTNFLIFKNKKLYFLFLKIKKLVCKY